MIDYNYIFKEIKIALRNLPGNACKIYLELGFHRDPYSYVTNIMTYAQLAEFSGVSKSHVREHIQLLQKEGIIEIIKITGKKHGSYQFYLKLDERLNAELKTTLQAKKIASQNGNKPPIQKVPNDTETPQTYVAQIDGKNLVLDFKQTGD